MGERKELATVTVKNWTRTALVKAELMRTPPKRVMIVGLLHVTVFGYSIGGVPQTVALESDEQQPTPNRVADEEDAAPEKRHTLSSVSHEVAAALKRDQRLPLSARCMHPLAVLRVQPKATSPISSRVNVVSHKDKERVNSEINRWPVVK